ncbi:type IX secretion system protein PorD [Salinimicrobium sp. CAU 1759]
MRNSFLLFLMLSLSVSVGAQELNCQVIVNAEQTGQANASVFKTLQNALTEFVNQTRWTNKDFLSQERINCSMFININSFEGNSFGGTIQIQSSRPVFGSTMVTPVLNFNDEQFAFEYTEYQPLEFSPNQFNSNLVSVISFYVYTILGLDSDTFSEQGGTSYYQTANQIVGTAQQSSYSGWKGTDGNRSRYQLNADLLSNTYSGYRNALYTYHREGLDVMHMSPEEGKEAVASSIIDLQRMNSRRPNSLLLRTFFDAKADEVEQIFSGGPSVNIREVVDALNTMAPNYTEKWGNIRY